MILIKQMRGEHRGDSDKTNQRSEHSGDSDKTNQRSEHMGDSDKTNLSNLYRGPSIDASCQVSVYLAKLLQKRRIFKISQSETSR